MKLGQFHYRNPIFVLETGFVQTLLAGEQGAFDPASLTRMQKMTLRFVVVGLVYYAFALIEGMLMRAFQVTPLPFVRFQPRDPVMLS